jgi:hypothetical protein
MPHRRNIYKLTGDTHPPEIADDFESDDLDDEASTVVALGEPTFRMQPASAVEAIPEQARDEVRRQPLVAMALAVAAGFVVMKLLRRRVI